MLTVGSANIYSFLHEESFVPSWRKFLSTMVERNLPHGGTKTTPWWKDLASVVFSLNDKNAVC